MEYKQKMLDFFIFSRTKGKENHDILQKEIISLIDWPIDDDVDKDGPLWKVVTDYINQDRMNYQVNIFRWYELFADGVNGKPDLVDKLLKRYQAMME